MRADATRHGGEMLRQGFTIAQVVHDYGDICQAITELAVESAVEIDAGEFRTLNLCLDNAIAEAVTEFLRNREQSLSESRPSGWPRSPTSNATCSRRRCCRSRHCGGLPNRLRARAMVKRRAPSGARPVLLEERRRERIRVLVVLGERE
jgi:hypothetical protein